MKKIGMIFLAIASASAIAADVTECEKLKSKEARKECFAAFASAQCSAGIKQIGSPADKKAEKEVATKSSTEFNGKVRLFLSDTRTRAASCVLTAENFWFSPSGDSAREVTSCIYGGKKDYESKLAEILSMNGANPEMVSRLKDYFSTWGSSMISIAPTTSDSKISHSIRARRELRTIEEMSARLLLDVGGPATTQQELKL